MSGNYNEAFKFVDDYGDPLNILLDATTIRSSGARHALKAKIERHGGQVATDDLSDVYAIIVKPRDDDHLEQLRAAYGAHSNPHLCKAYVEKTTWIQSSINNKRLIHYRRARKGMGGVAARNGRERRDFTAEEDEKLAVYLAKRIPDKTDGGRTGNLVYKQLMENYTVLPLEYEWVMNHTEESWRERYKKNHVRFDKRINELVVELEPQEHQKFPYSRKASRRAVRQYTPDSEEDDDEDELDEEADATSRKRRVSGSAAARRDAKRRRVSSGSSRPRHRPEEEEEEEDEEDAGGAANPERSPLLASQPIHSTSKGKEKEMAPSEDEDDYNDLFDGPYTQSSPPPLTQHQVRSSQTLVATHPSPRNPTPASPPHPPIATLAEVRPSPLQEKQKRGRPRRQAQPSLEVEEEVQQPTTEVREEAQGTPYRSTRARTRSESAEPVHMMDNPDAALRRNKKQKKKVLEPVEEILMEEEGVVERVSSQMETQEDEQDVEGLLLNLNDQSGLSEEALNPVEEEDDVDHRMPPPRETRRPAARQSRQHPASPALAPDDRHTDQALRRQRQRSPPLTTDDEQTAQALRRHQRHSSTAVATDDDGQTDQALRRQHQVSFSPSIAGRTPQEVLQALQGPHPRLSGSRPPESVAASSTKGRDTPLLATFFRSGSAQRQRRQEQNSPTDVFSVAASSTRRGSVLGPSVDAENPLYGGARAGYGRGSVAGGSRRSSGSSSTGSFPFPNTRARSLKLELKSQEKHTPYRPPRGTRAAALT